MGAGEGRGDGAGVEEAGGGGQVRGDNGEVHHLLITYSAHSSPRLSPNHLSGYCRPNMVTSLLHRSVSEIPVKQKLTKKDSVLFVQPT